MPGPWSTVVLTADQARRIALWAQGLSGSAPRGAPVDRVRAVLDRLGAVQLDTICVLARSHELVAYARLGALSREAIDEAYWDGQTAFEYWSHAACILPVRMWPWFAFRRRAYRRRGWRWHQVPMATVDAVRARLRTDGPLTTRELGGAKRTSDWWDWSDAKVAIEWLLDVGEVVCTQRSGWRRVYDIAERAIPAHLHSDRHWVDIDGVCGPDDDECLRILVQDAVRTLGVGTLADIADVHRLGVTAVAAVIEDCGLPTVSVRGWTDRCWAHPDALEWLDSGARSRSRTTLLSPFDSLIWERTRAERLFGMRHRIEAYVPAAKRVHGYFAMPVLHAGRLVARVDPVREKEVLVARRVTLEAGVPIDTAVTGTARALAQAREWVSSQHVRVDEVVAPGLSRRASSGIARTIERATLGS